MEQYIEFYIGGIALVFAGLVLYINKLFSYKNEAKVENVVEQPVAKKPRKPRTVKADATVVKADEAKKPASTRGRKPKVAVVEVKKPASTRGRKPKAVEVPVAKTVKPRTKKA